MKTTFVVIGVLVPLLTQAQGTVYSSNLGSTPTGSFAVASNSLVAQGFAWLGHTVNGVTLTPPCILNSVQLLMDSAAGNASNFGVSIYTSDGGPGASLGPLIGDSDPESPDIYTYTASGITLYPSTAYYVVVTSGTAAVEGAYNWRTTTSPSQDFNNNLRISGSFIDSTDGSNWNSHGRGGPQTQLAIYGTPIPEPSTASLLVVTGLLLGAGRGCRTMRCRQLASAVAV